uniref:Mitochondrial-processing peptidase subunit beta n=1 Tax=Macrostomum lignano TaxID=282301 RepID=A0A1I8J718_9PLAT
MILFNKVFRNRLFSYNSLSSLVRQFSQYATASVSPSIAKVPEARISQLENGMRVASENWGTPTCTVGVWVDAGSRFETDYTNGAAHFLEHMAFKGTRSRSQQDIELDVENRGAHLNAYTSREMTVYYAKCFSRDLPWAVAILADILRNSTFEEAQIERERGVILREMQEVETNLQEVVFDYLHAVAYQSTPLSRTILGPVENVKSLRRQDLQQYVADHYRPQRMVVAAAGAIDHTELNDLCRRHFGSMPAVEASPGAVDQTPVRFSGSSILDPDDQLPFAHVALAVEGPGWSSADTVPLMLASAYIGSWDRAQGGGSGSGGSAAARLAKRARDTYGGGVLSYQSFFTCYTDTSLWGMHAVANKESVGRFLADFQADWRRLARGIEPADLACTRDALLTSLYLQLDGTTPACEELGRHVLCYGRRVPLAELEERIMRVTPESLAEVVGQYVYDRCPALAAVGPTGDLPDYAVIRRGMFSGDK